MKKAPPDKNIWYSQLLIVGRLHPQIGPMRVNGLMYLNFDRGREGETTINVGFEGLLCSLAFSSSWIAAIYHIQKQHQRKLQLQHH